MAKLSQAQLNDLLELQWQLYQRQAAYNVGDECKQTMDAAQKVMRTLATDTPTPPDPSDPLARMRLAPSQLSMWVPATSEEISAMYDLHNRIAVAHQLAFYGPGGVGNVQVFQTGAATYNFVRFFDEAGNRYPNDEARTVPDVNGAGDAYVALMAQLSGLPVIAPLSP